jgi:hypothetical protein
MDTVGIHVPSRQIKEFSTFSMSNVLRYIPSARYQLDKPLQQMAYVDFWMYLAKSSLLRILTIYRKVFRFIICFSLFLFSILLLVFACHSFFAVGKHSNKGIELNYLSIS